jgi:hypothetical protein
MKLFFISILIALTLPLTAQQRYNAALLDTLQEISNSNSIAKHFGKLYYEAIEATNKYAAKQPDSVRNFIFGFESLFAPAFFSSYHKQVSYSAQTNGWQFYYSDTSLNEMQYKFIGMNTHINGDMWLALKDKYDYDSLKKYHKPLIQFQKVLNVFFDSIYVTTRHYKKLKRLRFFTLGMDRNIGRHMVLSWRKKQVGLAMLYYSDPEKWKRELKRSEKRMKRWNRFALKWIK